MRVRDKVMVNKKTHTTSLSSMKKMKVIKVKNLMEILNQETIKQIKTIVYLMLVKIQTYQMMDIKTKI